MEWPPAHIRATGRNDTFYSRDGIEAIGLHSEQENGRRTQEIRYSETVGDKKRVNIHSQKYATRWDPEFSPGIRHRFQQAQVPRPGPYIEYSRRAHADDLDYESDQEWVFRAHGPREVGQVFNFRLKKPESSEEAPTQTGPEVPSSTSGVRKWATLRLEKDASFQENEFKVLRSRYKSNPSALQHSIAELEREEKRTTPSDSQPLLLQWK